jgi:hypothetical protein
LAATIVFLTMGAARSAATLDLTIGTAKSTSITIGSARSAAILDLTVGTVSPEKEKKALSSAQVTK